MSIGLSEFDFIRGMVREHAAIVLDAGKEYLVDQRLTPLAQEEGFASIQELVGSLRARSFNGLHVKVVEAMTTNETSFFRDIHPFQSLRQTVLPDCIAKRSADRSLKIWCAACSSGQEPYSIAMLLHEHFPSLLGWNVKLIATDLSRKMIARAQLGRFNQIEINRGLPANLLVKYFKNEGLEWQLKDSIRQMVDFEVMNLTTPWPIFPALDIVFIRNVMIYFDVETKQKILGKIRRILRRDGYLFLGGAETTLNLDDSFERLQLDKGSCYQLRK
jgi:chemotaxis protein methyltransferase CheR